ncbi:sugar phosphate isomerase/epimerase family protein [Telluribacter humicola]|uniref:sugar phosphate isomerase/epimerase family protein n=1 Tax=Telluribacter humicola TaxID=1720261 RepID=UPI001A972787|nr:sugar phosphate isomerase/epimerase family protein [Telluribacter humicola]
MKPAVTIALVPQIRKGPWIYWDDLETSMQKAAELGFPAVELFTPSPLDAEQINKLCMTYGLQIAAVGTGAGKVLQGLTLTDPDPHVRQKATGFIQEMIHFGAQLGAPAIIGSMQGNVPVDVNREQALEWLAQGLNHLGSYAESQEVPLIYEPLNRYETNLINRLGEGARFLNGLGSRNVRLLADLFHMNIEETSLADSIREAGSLIGHVHYADSHRGPMGTGHTEVPPVMEALRAIGYDGYVSAEAFPWPTPDEAARKTIASFRLHFVY